MHFKLGIRNRSAKDNAISPLVRQLEQRFSYFDVITQPKLSTDRMESKIEIRHRRRDLIFSFWHWIERVP